MNPPTTAAAAKQPLLNTTLKWFMLAMVLANTASMMYLPLLPLYLSDLQASVLDVGMFFTLSSMIPLALQILGGWLSDSLGRLRSIAIGSLAGVLSYIPLILAPTWQWVLAAEALSSMTRALVAPSFSAFIAEQSSEANRARVYGITETIFTVVSIAGPPLGGLLAQTFGFKVMLITAACLYALATLIRVAMARLAARGATQASQPLSFASLKLDLKAITLLVLSGGVMTWIVLTDGVRDVIFTMAFTLESLYLEQVGGLTFTQIGLLSSLFGVANMLITIPAGWLADKKGERLTIALGYGLHALGLVAFVSASSLWHFGAAWVIYGLGVGLIVPAYHSLTSKVVPEKLRGTAFGLVSTGLGIFSLPAPAVGAQLWERFSPRLPFQIAAVVAALTVIPVWFKFRLPENQPAPPPHTGGAPALPDPALSAQEP